MFYSNYYYPGVQESYWGKILGESAAGPETFLLCKYYLPVTLKVISSLD